METDAAVIEKVRQVRSAIESVLARAVSRPLAEVLGSAESGPAYVVKVLDVHPCLGKVAGRRLLRESGIGERTRLADLSPADRDVLVHGCRCGHE